MASNAINRSKVKIWIDAAGTAASSLASSDAITGEIKSYAKSGGEKDVESDAVFGGFVDKDKPVTQVELSFEIVPTLNASGVNRWDAYAYAVDAATGVYTMASATSTQASDRTVYIEATDGTLYKSWGFNNASVTLYDLEHNADDNQSGNMTMKLSPEDDSGVSNFMTAATAVTSLPAWTALDNN